jgi:hypothetical protein
MDSKKMMTAEEMESDVSMATEALGAPVTSERKLNPNLQDQLQKPCKQSNCLKS